MSFDYQLINECPHLLLKEVSVLVDQRILRAKHPFNNSSAVRVFFNGTELLAGSRHSGWDIILDPTLVTSALMIQFKRERKESGVYQISYQSPREYCDRCVGQGWNYDPHFDRRVEKTDKLAQTLEKTLLTRRGSNKAFPSKGTSIVSIIGKTRAELSSVMVQQEVFFAMDDMQRSIIKQKRYQAVADEEIPKNIESIKVEEWDIESMRIEVLLSAIVGGLIKFSKVLRRVAQ